MHLSILVLILATARSPLASAYIGHPLPLDLLRRRLLRYAAQRVRFERRAVEGNYGSLGWGGTYIHPRASSILFAHMLPFGNPHNIFATSASSPRQVLLVL